MIYNFYVKTFLKSFASVYLSLYFVQQLFAPFDFGGTYKTLVVVLVAFTIVYFFAKPVLGIVSFPVGGFGYFLLTTGVSIALLYALMTMINDFTIGTSITPEISFMSFYLKSYVIEGFMSIVFTGACINLFHGFISWLYNK